MNGLELESIVLKDPAMRNKYAGCFNTDNMPSELRRDNFIIVNVSSDVTIIGHWCCFLMTRDAQLIFIDSLGNSADYYGGGISKFYTSYNGIKRCVIDYRLQSEHSLLCGGYVIYFLYWFYRHCKFNRLLKKLLNRRRNYQRIEKFLFRINGMRRNCSNTLCPRRTFN